MVTYTGQQFEALNDLFMKITSIIISFMPVAVFCSICSMVLGMGSDSMIAVLKLNVPVEAVGLVMCIDPLVGMFRCMNNCMGDAVVSTIVARKENALDMEIYKG